MPNVPEDVLELLAMRERARADRDFARADHLRDAILAQGFSLKDTPGGAVVEAIAASSEQGLDQPPSLDLSLHVLYEEFPEDLSRFLGGLAAHNDLSSVEVVVVDNASENPGEIDAIIEPFPAARAIHLPRALGWAAARNAGLKTARGAIIALVDLSIEPVGDIVTPLRDAFADPLVGCAGPFGLRSESMRDWEPSEGPEVDALEGYLLATRRQVLAGGLIREKFTWYRNADIDLSFQIRSEGLSARVVDLPVRKHAHRGWEALATEPDKRDAMSRRNHYLFFDRWKDRTDLLNRTAE